MTTLREYAKANGLTQERLAKKLGVTQGVVSSLMTNRNRPSLELAVKIERLTDGAVPARSWIPVDEMTR